MTPKKPAMQPLARAAMPARKKSTATPFRDATDKPGLQPLARASLLGRKKMVGQTDKEDAKKVALQPLARASMPVRKKPKAMNEGGLAMFEGKETAKEEMKEAEAVKSGKITPKQYAAGEKKEGHGKGAMRKARALRAGKLSAAKYAAGHKRNSMMGSIKTYAMPPKPAKKPAAKKPEAETATSTSTTPAMKKGGCVKKYARGGGIELRGKTKGKFI